MASILVITASPHGTSSRGASLAMQAIANLKSRDRSLHVVERDLAELDLSALGRDYADAVVGRRPHDDAAFSLSETLIRELEDAAYVVIATPMHNYTVPASLKLWIDLVLRFGRTFQPVDGVKTGMLSDRPTLVVVTSGGLVAHQERRQPDHLTGYLTDVLATIGIRDLQFIYLEGLVNPEQAQKVVVEGARTIEEHSIFGPRLLV